MSDENRAGQLSKKRNDIIGKLSTNFYKVENTEAFINWISNNPVDDAVIYHGSTTNGGETATNNIQSTILVSDQKQLNNICAKDGQHALKCINSFVSLY